MTKPMTYEQVRDTVASWSIEGKRLPIVEFIDSQQREIERLQVRINGYADTNVELRVALKVARQAILEFQHAQECGPSWYTRGESGMYAQVRLWLRRGTEAVQKALGPYNDNGEFLAELPASEDEAAPNARDWMCRACTAGPFTHDDLDQHWTTTHAQKLKSPPQVACANPVMVSPESYAGCRQLEGHEGLCDLLHQKSSADWRLTSAEVNCGLTIEDIASNFYPAGRRNRYTQLGWQKWEGRSGQRTTAPRE